MLAIGSKTSGIICRIQPGYISDPDVHPEEQGNYLLQGKEIWCVGDEGKEQAFEMTAGSLLIIEPNERHWARVIGDEEVILLCFFGPPRPDHLCDLGRK